MLKNHINGKKFSFNKFLDLSPEKLGPIDLFQLSETLCIAGFSCPVHKQWCHEIIYVISGEGLTIVDNKEVKLTSGDIFITPLYSEHQVKAVSELRYQIIGFKFNEEAKGEDLDILKQFFLSPPFEAIKGNQEVATVLNKCLDEYYNSLTGYKLMVESLLIQLLNKIYRIANIKTLSRRLSDESFKHIGLTLYSVLLFIETNIYNVNDVATIAKTLGYNSCYLSHLFKKQIGITIQQYLCNRKIEESINLIKNEDLSISEVSHIIGYSSPQAFSRAFKRVKGISPSVYVKNNIAQRKFD